MGACGVSYSEKGQPNSINGTTEILFQHSKKQICIYAPFMGLVDLEEGWEDEMISLKPHLP